MEREFCTKWHRIMDVSQIKLLTECERQVLEISSSAIQSLATSLQKAGQEAARLENMSNTAYRSCTTSLEASFLELENVSLSTQRELNRCLLPSIKEKMQTGYDAAMSVARGKGVLERMKEALQENCDAASMFDESPNKLLGGITDLIKHLAATIISTCQLISKDMETIFSLCWDDQSDDNTLLNLARKRKSRECREALLPELNRLFEDQKTAADLLLGIERDDLELDVVGVESLDQTLERKLKEAERKGTAFDLRDSDAELDAECDVKPAAKAFVKAEPIPAPETGANKSTQKKNEIIDLCNSDDEMAPTLRQNVKHEPSGAP
jgi:hypothetical protein